MARPLLIKTMVCAFVPNCFLSYIISFLSLDDPKLKVPGNVGLKDQVMALRWIQQNCLSFNGNPENVTLFGHSAGGCSTQFLMLADQCKGLFHKAILMAGFALFYEKVPNLPYRLAKEIGYDGENIDNAVLEFLSKVDAHKLVNFNLWTQEEKDQGFGYAFMVRKEPYESEDSIFTREPIEILRTSWSNDIPIMLGGTSLEGLLMYNPWKNEQVFENFRQHPEYFLPLGLQYAGDLALRQKLGKEMINIHFGEKNFGSENVFCGLDYLGYGLTYHPTHRTINSRGAYGSAPTYLYRFDFDSPTFNLYRIKHCGPDVRGAGHVDELSYIFYMPQSFKLERNSEEFKMILRMVALWTTFAEKSNPNTSAISPIVWLPTTHNGSYKCLNISKKINCIVCPEQFKCELWDQLYAKAGLPLI